MPRNERDTELTEPQKRMIARAARSEHHGGTWVRRGQASTARKLAEMGLAVVWSPDAYTSRVRLTDAGQAYYLLARTAAMPGTEAPS